MGDLADTIRGDASRISIISKIDLSCGCERSFFGHPGSIRVGDVWGCDPHGNAVILAVATTIDGTARDALVWISDRTGAPAEVTVTDRPDRPIESVRLARRPAHLQGDLGKSPGRDPWPGAIDLGDDPDGDNTLERGYLDDGQASPL